MEMYSTCLGDPGGNMIRKLVISTLAQGYMLYVKYAFCGQMRKLSFMLDKAYTESKLHGAPNKENVCVTCSSPITSRRLGDFAKSNCTCKLCFGHVCYACKVVRKLSFVDPDLQLSKRMVTFCTACISSVTTMNAMAVVREKMLSKNKGVSRTKSTATLGSEMPYTSS